MGGPLVQRLRWALFKRRRMARDVEGFWASPLSNVSDSARFEGFNSIYEHAEIGDASLGRFTYVGMHARVVNCSVGRFCSIGHGALVGGLGVHPSKWLSTHPVFFSERRQAGRTTFSDRNYVDELPPTTIGNDVWIGARAIVLDGHRVGDGAIVAAGAVVTTDVEPYTIVGGVPAKAIRMRFDAADVARLLAIKWWEWPVEKLRGLAPLFREEGSTGIDRLLKQ